MQTRWCLRWRRRSAERAACASRPMSPKGPVREPCWQTHYHCAHSPFVPGKSQLTPGHDVTSCAWQMPMPEKACFSPKDLLARALQAGYNQVVIVFEAIPRVVLYHVS